MSLKGSVGKLRIANQRAAGREVEWGADPGVFRGERGSRLIGSYLKCGEVKTAGYKRHRFTARYSSADVELLAEVDEAHDTMSGPATRRILERELHEYGKREYERLAGISSAHLYNLRKQSRYRERRLHYSKTRPSRVNIGERRKPQPEGKPGYLRVDRFIKAIRTASRAFITSTLWMR